MFGTAQDTSSTSTAGALRRAARYAIAASVTTGVVLSVAAIAPAAQAAAGHATASSPAKATARIQNLLDNPVNGVVNLPHGTFTIRPTLKLRQSEQIIGHHTTLRVASGSGNYRAMLAGLTDLSGLVISGVTFDENAAGNPIHSVPKLYSGSARFALLLVAGTGMKIINDRFIHCDNVNTIATGGGTRNVTISGNAFSAIDVPMHDHSSIYTDGSGAVISNNTFTGRAAYATAIETHGDHATVTGNRVSGYYKAANIVSANTTFSGNHVSRAANPIDLWSVGTAGLHNVKITRNVLNLDRAYWKKALARIGRVIPARRLTRQVIRDASSTQPFRNINVHANRAS